MKPRRLHSATISSRLVGLGLGGSLTREPYAAHGVAGMTSAILAADADLRVPLRERPQLRGLPVDVRRPGRPTARSAGRRSSASFTRRRPLQGLGLLHDRLREKGQRRRRRRRVERLEGRRLEEATRARSELGEEVEVGSKADEPKTLEGRRVRRTDAPQLGEQSGSRGGLVAEQLLGACARTPPARRPGCRRRSSPDGSSTSVAVAADRRREHELRHRQRAHVETIAFGAFQPISGPLMKLIGQRGDAGQLALDPVEDQLLELRPGRGRRRVELARRRQAVRCACARG